MASLEKETWNDIYKSKDVNLACKKFMKILKMHIEDSSKIIYISSKYKRIKP